MFVWSQMKVCLIAFNLRTFIFSKYFPGHKLPINVIATTDAKAALLGADFCFHAVPVQVFHYSIEISSLIFVCSS